MDDIEVLQSLPVIGKGSQGTVYKKDELAIKVTSDVCEASILKLVDHPNIIKVEDVYIVDEKVVMVMPFYHSTKLKNNEIEKLLFLFKLAHAIFFLHSNDILHRDIKLSNVLFNKGSPILIDFGIACICDSETGLKSTKYMGTETYMPPELARYEDNIYNDKTDVWSFGIVCEKLVGKNLSKHILVKDPTKRPSMKEVLELECFQKFKTPKPGKLIPIDRPCYEYEKFGKIVNIVTECYHKWAINSPVRSYFLSIELIYSILPYITFDPKRYIIAAICIARNITESKTLVNNHEQFVDYVGSSQITSLRKDVLQICKWLNFHLYRNPYYKKLMTNQVITDIIFGDISLYPHVNIDEYLKQ